MIRAFLVATALLSSTISQAGIIAVNGTAEKFIAPNLVRLSLDVWAKGSTAQKAQAGSAQAMQNVRKTLESFKISQDDIQTENYTVNPEYVWEQNKNRLTGYRASQQIRVTVRKLADAGPLLDQLSAGTKAGDMGVSVSSSVFDSDKKFEAELAGLSEAIRMTKAKAEEMAKAAGVKVVAVSRLSHGVTESPVIPVVREAKMMMAGDSAPTQLSPGQIKVDVEVRAEYEVK